MRIFVISLDYGMAMAAFLTGKVPLLEFVIETIN
jgi:hypothetical protein